MLVNDEGEIFSFKAIQLDSAVEVGNIYQSQNFAAFTDIANYNGTWYVVFRIGTSHVGGENGQIKIMTSKDGIEWHVKDNIIEERRDLRGPHLTVDSANDDLYLNYFSRNALRSGKFDIVNYISKLNKSTSSWLPARAIQYENSYNTRYIFWRYTYHKGRMYSIAYRSPLGDEKEKNLGLFNSGGDFYTYQFSGPINVKGRYTETTLRITETDSMYFIPRTETVNTPIGISIPSYNIVKWDKNPFSSILESPNFLFYKNKLLVTARDSKRSTFKLFSYDIETKKVQKTYTFPAGNETGYGGMSFNPSNPDELWISYYSITNTQSLIKLAKINLLKFLK
ncbi:hypothetical protein SAMN05444277_107184 [Parafilimonas terrae]|uniref:BNR repeat-containing family member n=2 Tax=Parafilimonas terrae TaxID=1465490 RepID=A0A1I5X3N8_9BACT|nr:hypothetical protein SAMN05444277_107184 [Parafilimonas terrae]